MLDMTSAFCMKEVLSIAKIRLPSAKMNSENVASSFQYYSQDFVCNSLFGLLWGARPLPEQIEILLFNLQNIYSRNQLLTLWRFICIFHPLPQIASPSWKAGDGCYHLLIYSLACSVVPVVCVRLPWTLLWRGI